ncbi:unnamed protein product [Prorocentrum cordatum]|uniref:TauD/TfdA-like domain-containing protein n=1 Tax=Prorocentrum cordatum TaxID=2364126 RepID=A0ABN9W3L5_9DINO|nr:unnamed protein product [Polarella glacialis]
MPPRQEAAARPRVEGGPAPAAPSGPRPVAVVGLAGSGAAARLAEASRAAEAELQLAPGQRPDLNDGEHFKVMWDVLTKTLGGLPLFGAEHLAALERSAAVVLRFGSDVFPQETALPTPLMRPCSFPGDPPLDMDFDYLSLAVACQVVLHRPDLVSGVHSFKQLYGGRLITEIIPEAGEHTEFTGETRRNDPVRQAEGEMRLHVDDADHLLRARLQLLVGVNNPAGIQTTFAVVPQDQVIQSWGGCDVGLLRQPLFRSFPPSIVKPDAVPLRPLLFGPEEWPMVQADQKALQKHAEAEFPSFETSSAAHAWSAFHSFLRSSSCLSGVVVGPGDVLLLDNYRMMHGREEIPPVPDVSARRWVKRLWLSAAPMEAVLDGCARFHGHPRVFDRLDVFEKQASKPHPDLPASGPHAERRPSQ